MSHTTPFYDLFNREILSDVAPGKTRPAQTVNRKARRAGADILSLGLGEACGRRVALSHYHGPPAFTYQAWAPLARSTEGEQRAHRLGARPGNGAAGLSASLCTFKIPFSENLLIFNLNTCAQQIALF